MFALSDRLATANGTMREGVSRERKHSQEAGTVYQAAQSYKEASSRLGLCQPSVFLLGFFSQDSLPGPKRCCKAFMNEFPEVSGRTECEYPFDVC